MTEFVIVLCNDSVFLDKYMRFKKSQGIDVINHKEIKQKLENNDIYKSKPTDSILKFVLISRIKKSIDSPKIDTIFYKVDEINQELIESLELVMGTYFNKTSLNLILHEDVDIKDIAYKFGNVSKVV